MGTVQLDGLVKFGELLAYQIVQAGHLCGLALARYEEAPHLGQLARDGLHRLVVGLEISRFAGEEEPTLSRLGVNQGCPQHSHSVVNFPASGAIRIGAVVLPPLAI